MKKTNSTKGRNQSRSLRIEELESRELLAIGVDLSCCSLSSQQFETSMHIDNALLSDWFDVSTSNLNPSSIEQELLEQINRFRSDPKGEIDRIFSVATSDTLIAHNDLVNSALALTSYPSSSIETFLNEMNSIVASAPLAFNSSLEKAASSHSSYMKSRNDISHQCSGEASLTSRISKSGFQYGSNDNGIIPVSENIGGSFVKYKGWSIASYIEAAFVVDWGVPSHTHRDAMSNSAYTEIGISIQQTNKSIGPYLVTCDFGTSIDGARTDGAYLLGVIYDDMDGDRFYDVDEGLGNISVLIENLSGEHAGETTTITSWDSGGYQLFLKNGSYKVTVSGDGFATPVSKTVNITDGVNTKLDFLKGEAGSSVPVIYLDHSEESENLTVVFQEGSEEPFQVFAQSTVSIKDSDSSYLYEAKIYFGFRPEGSNETLDLSIANTGLSATFNEQSGFISITGTGTIAEYEKAISSLTYFNESDICDLASRTVLITVYDGNNWSDNSILTIDIQPTVLPNMTVHEMIAYEGDQDSKVASFVVELDSPARLDISFNFQVKLGGTAIEGEHFVIPVGEPVIIRAGETSATIDCYIIGNYEPLKPEGLALIDGVYENPFTDFFITIMDLENAYLTNVDSVARGVIYDDDSPIVLGLTDKYEFSNTLSTDSGQRRYVFSLTPENSGIFTWNADSLALPIGSKVTVYKEGLESEPIAVSTITTTGCNVQWFADHNLEYWITVESETDLTSIAARLLAISEDKVVLVDPLLDEDMNLVSLMWDDDELLFNVEDFFWNLGDSFWNEFVFSSSRNDIEFSMNFLPFNSSVVSTEEDVTSIAFDPIRGITTTGFSIYRFNGNGENEFLSLTGTSGKDDLYYSDGSGSFLRSDGVMYFFSGINSVEIDGNGGDDSAYIEDSYSNDRLETCNDLLAMYGSGYSLIAKCFSDAKVFFNKGGEDSFYATDYGDDVSAYVSKNSTFFSGTFELSNVQENLSNSLLEEEESKKQVCSYTRMVSGVEHLVLAPKETIGSVILYADSSAGAYFNAEVGALFTYNTKTSTTATVSRVKSLVISSSNKFIDDRLTVNLPSSYQTHIDGNSLVVVDKETNWTLAIPTWKAIEEDVSAVLIEENFEKEEGTSGNLIIDEVKFIQNLNDGALNDFESIVNTNDDNVYIDHFFTFLGNSKQSLNNESEIFYEIEVEDNDNVFGVLHALNESSRTRRRMSLL